MAAEAGHHPNRMYVDRSGNVHLNGASLFDASENDIKTGVAGLTAGVKIASGTVTLDGTNPTPVTTGLTAVVSAVVSLKAAATPGDDPTSFSVGYSGGTLNIYAYKVDGTDPTLIASTNNAATVDWIAVGT